MKKKRIAAASIIVILLVGAASFVGMQHAKKRAALEEEAGSEAVLDKLKALPYVGYVEEDRDPTKSNVSTYDQEDSYRGVNLYIPTPMRRAFLLDMKGEVLNTWKPTGDTPPGQWLYSELDEEGKLVLLINRVGLFRLDRESSRAEAIVEGTYHHDFAMTGDGDIYTISRDRVTVPLDSREIYIVDDYLSRVSPGGLINKRISMWELFGDRVTGEVLKTIPRKSKKPSKKKSKKLLYDLFHTNTVEIIHRDTEIARKGDILICLRNLDLIAVVDPEEEKVVWSWGRGVLDRPHQPTMLENGNILVFDNGMNRDHSRIIEYDPAREKIVWEYREDPPEGFHSRTRGANQRLPNGNTLITESSKGRVFEVTGEGRIVWEFFNPHFGKKKKQDRRKTIYRMVRFEPEILDRLN